MSSGYIKILSSWCYQTKIDWLATFWKEKPTDVILSTCIENSKIQSQPQSKFSAGRLDNQKKHSLAVSASDTRSLLDNTLQACQYGLCPVVTADDDLGVQGKHHELLVAAFMYQGRDNIREKHSSVPIIMLRCWPDPSLVKGVAPKFNQCTTNWMQGTGRDSH